MESPAVSFCTVVMNRLNHLRMTLPVNMQQNNDSSVEFVVLDYSSEDGVGDYIQSNFKEEMCNGQLVYYRYDAADYFHRSHSKNMALRLGRGEVVCSLDADNYAGEGFGAYVANKFSANAALLLTGLENKYRHDASGKLCVSRKKFIEVTGFDEKLSGYGFEDYDIVNRLGLAGCDPFTINKTAFLETITHDDLQRLENEGFYKNVDSVYVHYIDPGASKLLYLLKDQTFLCATIVNTYLLNTKRPMAAIRQNKTVSGQFRVTGETLQGNWRRTTDSIYLENIGGGAELLNRRMTGTESFGSADHLFHKVNALKMKLDAISFFTQNQNRQVLEENFKEKNISVNQRFGEGVVCKNFSNERIKIGNQ